MLRAPGYFGRGGGKLRPNDIGALPDLTALDWSADYFAVLDVSSGQLAKVKPYIFGREKLTANRTYYVRTDGSDANNGLANTSGGAFLTIQKALDTVAALDIGTYNVTVQLADGTYTGSSVGNGPWLGSGTVKIVGNSVTPANVIVQDTATTNGVIAAKNGCALTVEAFELRASGAIGVGLWATANGVINLGASMRFGACTNYHMLATNAGIINSANLSYTVAGNAACHLNAGTGGIFTVNAMSVTLSGTIAFSSAYAVADRAGIIEYYSNTFTGTATGSRYSANRGGGIFVNGGGTSYLPGNSAGSATSPGWYA